MKVLIIGAGLYGATLARALWDAGHEPRVMERRMYVGGQVHTTFNVAVGCYMHDHGPHIFRTSSEAVWAFVNRFATFNRFVNRPKAVYRSKLYSFPINLMTLYQVFGVTTPVQARAAIAKDCVKMPRAPQNMEQWCLQNMGTQLYSIFIEGYTTKQWGRHPRDLPASLLRRLPIRLTFDDNYYLGNPHQGIPLCGYTAMVERMLEGIPVDLGVAFGINQLEWMLSRYDYVVYSGAIDEFFDYQFGELTYRQMRFETMLIDKEDYQGTAVINYTDNIVPFTRVIEHKHFDLIEGNSKTAVTWEYPQEWRRGGDQTYPLRTASSMMMFERYKAHAAAIPRLIFGGRLGTYAYLDMDQVITSAMARARTLAR